MGRGVASRLLEGGGEAIAVGEADPAGDYGQLVIGLADEPDGLLDSQVRQVVHRSASDLFQAETTEMLEAQSGLTGERLGVPREIESTMDLVP